MQNEPHARKRLLRDYTNFRVCYYNVLATPLRHCSAPMRTNNILAAGLKYKLINSIGATQLAAQSAQDDNDGNEDDDL